MKTKVLNKRWGLCALGNEPFAFRGFMSLLLLLATWVNFGQEAPKPALTEKDYNLWETMYLDKMSVSGKWISYGKRYDEKPSELFLKSTDGRKQFRFERAGGGQFSNENYFACLDGARALNIVDLKTGVIKKIDDVESYSFTQNGKYLVTMANKILSIRKSSGIISESIAGIDEYMVRDNMVVYTGSNTGVHRVQLLNLNEAAKVTDIAESEEYGFSTLVWHRGGNAVAFLKNGDERSICYYSLTEEKLAEFTPGSFPDTFNHAIAPAYGSGLSISTDGKRVFFMAEKKDGDRKKFDGIQIWNGNDAVVYPERTHIGDSEFNRISVAWWPELKKVKRLTTDLRPFGILNTTEDYALSYNIIDVGAQYVQHYKVNYYVTDIETGESNLLVPNQSSAVLESGFSPAGKYFAYHNDRQWFVYNFKTKKQQLVDTGKLGLSSPQLDTATADPYGVAGWGPDDEYLLLYDAFDIWKFPMNGGVAERLTKGKEKGVQYRIAPPVNNPFIDRGFRGHIDVPYDLEKGLVISAESDNETGYFFREMDGGLRKIVFDEMRNSNIIFDEAMEKFAFLAENYNKPPELHFKQKKGKVKRIAESNAHHYNYAWGKQETIHYLNSKGDALKGLLYYPSNFDPKNKYPMVVNIYEQQYYRKKQYNNPSFANMAGFNILNLVANGYFVFLPDIVYEIGDPGVSATDCVTAAVRKALERKYIDSAKVGLVGHSFGGYETNFIITQTDLFACAVSGASIADLPGWYLSIGWNDGKPELWRSESQQFRMGGSLFDDNDRYLRNSPVWHASKVNTPVLLWSGEDDRQVHYYQSITFYLALRRLNKKEILLIYPDEGHAMIKYQNRKDLTIRMSQWLDYYLKGYNPAEWMADGVK